MTAQKGRSCIIQVSDGAGTPVFTTIGGARNVSIAINNEMADMSNAGTNGIRTLLEGAGATSITMSFSGVYLDSDTAGQHRLRALVLANQHADFRIITPGTTNDGTYAGKFMVSTMEVTGEDNDVMTTSFTLESAGAVTFTPTA